ncbi:SDR_c [Peptoniphilus sp. ING2-D1G]|nr:SDR_c [Peptoniphilus sp. ING2-D1G]
MATILIVGANQGIGYYMAKRLLELNHQLAILDINIDQLEDLKQRYPGKLLSVVADAKDENSIRAGVEETLVKFNSIDCAIHNACLCSFDSEPDSDYALYKQVMDINYFGALRLAKLVLPVMRSARKGRIIFTSSGVGVTGYGNISPYASSKGAIESLAKCLAIENQAYNISFHIMHPPLTKTVSSSGLAIPQEFMVDAGRVGRGLADHIWSKDYLICHSLMQKIQMLICYRFPLSMGKMMWKMSLKAKNENQN